MKEAKVKGLFRRRGSPQWWMRYADKSGRVHRASTGTTEKKLAVSILGKKRTEVAENRHLDVKKIPNATFFELCTQYWDMHGKTLRMKGLKNMIEIWKVGLGNPSLRDLTQHKLELFLGGRSEEKKLSPSTRNRHLAMLKSMLNKAREWGLLYENPADSIKNMREEGARTRFLSTEEIGKLLDNAGERFRPVVVMALHAGMRRGEILGLVWADVDFQNRIITIQHSKSGKKRMIPMDDTLTETLKTLPSRFKKGLVFPTNRKTKGKTDANRPLTDTNHTFTRLLAKTKIENVRFHDLRHTFASHLAMNGVDLKTIQELLGHANINMTMRYSHLAPVHRAKAVKVLDSAYLIVTDTKTDTAEKQG